MPEVEMLEVLVVQHEACEPLGTIENALIANGVSPRFVRVQEGDPVPLKLGAAAGLIVMGGPMGVADQQRYPFLADEIRLIVRAVAEEKPVLGVCLGGQLLAAALGADVREAPRQEIGWHPVMLSAGTAADPLWQDLPASFTGFHWHGNFFEVPPGAVSLASSDLTPCQAFRFGTSAYGFQFHLEVTEAIVRDWTMAFAGELEAAGLNADAVLRGIAEHLRPMQEIAEVVFGRWAAQVCGAGSR